MACFLDSFIVLTTSFKIALVLNDNCMQISDSDLHDGVFKPLSAAFHSYGMAKTFEIAKFDTYRLFFGTTHKAGNKEKNS